VPGTIKVGDRVTSRVDLQHLGVRAGDQGYVVRVKLGLIDVRFERALILALLPGEIVRVGDG
jgi:hypothetical protein